MPTAKYDAYRKPEEFDNHYEPINRVRDDRRYEPKNFANGYEPANRDLYR